MIAGALSVTDCSDIKTSEIIDRIRDQLSQIDETRKRTAVYEDAPVGYRWCNIVNVYEHKGKHTGNKHPGTIAFVIRTTSFPERLPIAHGSSCNIATFTPSIFPIDYANKSRTIIRSFQMSFQAPRECKTEAAHVKYLFRM